MTTQAPSSTTKATWPVFMSKLQSRRDVAEGTMAFCFDKPAGWTYVAGQFIDMTLIEPLETDPEGNTRGFSIASAPYEDTMMAVRGVGSWDNPLARYERHGRVHRLGWATTNTWVLATPNANEPCRSTNTIRRGPSYDPMTWEVDQPPRRVDFCSQARGEFPSR